MFTREAFPKTLSPPKVLPLSIFSVPAPEAAEEEVKRLKAEAERQEVMRKAAEEEEAKQKVAAELENCCRIV